MIMNASKMSEMIRMKKKKLMEDKEVVTNDPSPSMNAQDVEDMKQKGRIEDTVMADPKINADDTMMDMSASDAGTAGLTEDEKKRMARLRMYMDDMDLSGK